MATKEEEIRQAVLLTRRATGVANEVAAEWEKLYKELYRLIDLDDTAEVNIKRIRSVYGDIDMLDEFIASLVIISSSVIAAQAALYGFATINPTKKLVTDALSVVIPNGNMSIKEAIVRAKGSSFTSVVNYTRQAYQQGWTRKELKNALGDSASQSINYTNTIARTSVNAVSNDTKKKLYEANPTLVDRVLFSATLDSRTSDICKNLDGTVYEIADAPVMPLHFNERSQLVPILVGEDAEEVKAELLPRPAVVPKTRKDFDSDADFRKYSVDGKMIRSDFSSDKAYDAYVKDGSPSRGMTSKSGKVYTPRRSKYSPVKGVQTNAVNYEAWLKTQPKYYQEDILGVAGTKKFRDGASLKEVTNVSPITQKYLDKAINKTR